jgi:TonB family protein
VHGHVKPSNVLVVADQIRLSSDRLLGGGQVGKNSPAPTVYDAPELADGRISAAADVWSLGITMVEALTQHPPVWDRSTSAEPVLAESIPPPFSDIARKCLRTDPAQRCTLSDIKGLLDPVDPAPVVEPVGEEIAMPGFSKKILAGALLALLAVAAVFMMRSHKNDPVPAAATQQSTPAPEPAKPAAQGSSGVTKGAVAARVMPDVSRSASRTVTGKIKVKVRVAVDASGSISNVRLESAGPSQYFANRALQAARQWKFKPAQVDGHAGASVWNLQFQFGRSKTEVSAAETSP